MRWSLGVEPEPLPLDHRGTLLSNIINYVILNQRDDLNCFAIKPDRNQQVNKSNVSRDLHKHGVPQSVAAAADNYTLNMNKIQDKLRYKLQGDK